MRWILILVLAGCSADVPANQEAERTDGPGLPPKVVEVKEDLTRFDEPRYKSQYRVDKVRVAPWTYFSFSVANSVDYPTENVHMAVDFDNPMYNCGEYAILKLLIDGERDAITFSRYLEVRGGELYQESITVEQFDKIVNAKTVECLFCETEFKLSDEHLAALRELAGKIER